MKRHALVGDVLHVVEIDENGKMLSQEQCNLDDAQSLRILRLGEEPATAVITVADLAALQASGGTAPHKHPVPATLTGEA